MKKQFEKDISALGGKTIEFTEPPDFVKYEVLQQMPSDLEGKTKTSEPIPIDEEHISFMETLVTHTTEFSEAGVSRMSMDVISEITYYAGYALVGDDPDEEYVYNMQTKNIFGQTVALNDGTVTFV